MAKIASSDELIGYRKLFEFSHKILACYELSEVLETLVDSIIEITGADLGLLISLDRPEPWVRVARQSSGEALNKADEYYSESVIHRVIDSGEPLLVNDALNDPELSKARSVFELSIRSVICVPMFDQGELVGLIYICNQSLANLFTPRHLEVITVFASQASLLVADADKRDALVKSEARYRSVVQYSPTAIAILQDGEMLFANQALLRLLKAESPKPLMRFKFVEFFDDPVEGDEIIGRLQEGEGFEQYECGLRDLKGGLLHVDLSAVGVGKDGAMQLVIHDMTQQKLILAERLRMDRLVAMGTLAAGVGHEINNPLAYVHANIDFAAQELSSFLAKEGGALDLSDSDVRVNLQDIQAGLMAATEGTQRIRDVVRGIQAFSRLDEGEPRRVYLDRPLEFSIDMAMSSIRHRARLVREIEPTPAIVANESRLGQVFLNLLINAAQAIDEGSPNENAITVRSFARSGNVVVEIHDTGPGIAPEVRSRLFEPFVTTKGPGEGSGLGLSISRSIINDLGGQLEVESEGGQGTCFRVVIPASKGPVTAKVPRPAMGDTRRRARVLIIDDEIQMGNALRRLFLGEHDVSCVTRAEDVFDTLKEHTFDVLLCDLRMPGVTGITLYEKLGRRYPRYLKRMAFVTAGPTSASEQSFLARVAIPVLSKPFDTLELRSLIQRFAGDEE
ncbi:MAG: ATP-binding protein [Bradymonadaceae bacterium]